MRIKARRPSAGVVIGTVALAFAMTGAAVALPGTNTVNSGDIVNGQVKSPDVRNDGLAGKDINEASLRIPVTEGPPPDSACDQPSEVGRLWYDIANNRLNVCPGGTWQYANLVD
ncbi:MAG: hypothetical protein M3355_03580 [Actinomycetota bacterium]|nr:hypothetical protein [Actinomycetota bacterium]